MIQSMESRFIHLFSVKVILLFIVSGIMLRLMVERAFGGYVAKWQQWNTIQGKLGRGDADGLDN